MQLLHRQADSLPIHYLGSIEKVDKDIDLLYSPLHLPPKKLLTAVTSVSVEGETSGYREVSDRLKLYSIYTFENKHISV